MARHVHRNLLRVLSAIIAAIVGPGCIGGGVEYGPAPEYGVPATVLYSVTGTVRDAQSTTPVQGIEVRLSDTLGTQLVGNDYTDSAGRYAVELSLFPPEYAVRVRAVDTDGAANGAYVTRDTVLHIDDADIADGRVDRVVDIGIEPAN